MDPERLGKYEIRRVLGKGAMGTVYEGWDPVIERQVAIKTVRLPSSHDPDALEEVARFRREAQAAGRLSHPNIVGVYDTGETGDLAWIVMEYVDGPSLKAGFDRSERMPLPEIGRVMDGLLAGLAYSHGRGVVHRDIKPANVMLTSDGAVKIADFGIARIESSSMTQVGTVLGTPAYMSPEQFRGETVDARSDIYSAGVVLYQLLTGERPFDGSASAIMHKALNTEPPRPSDLAVTAPTGLDPVVAKAMARRPSDRFANAAEFAGALRRAIAGDGVSQSIAMGPEAFDADATMVSPATRTATATQARPPAPPPPGAASHDPAAPRGRSSAGMVIGGGTAALAAIAASVWFFVLRGPEPAPTPPPQPQPQAAQDPVPPTRTADATPPAPSPQPPAPPQASVDTPPPAAPPQPPAPTFVLPPLAPSPAPAPQQATPEPPPQRAEPTPAPQPQPQIQAQPAPPVTPQTQPPPPAAVQAPEPQAPPPAAAPAPQAATQPPAAPPPAVTQAPAPQPTSPVVTPAPEPPPTPPASVQAPAAPPPPQPQVAAAGPTAGQIREALSARLTGLGCTLATGDMQGERARVAALTRAGAPEGMLRAAIAAAAPGRADLRVRTFAADYCPAIDAVRGDADRFGARASGLAVGLSGGGERLLDHDAVRPVVTMPDFPAYLTLLYLTRDEQGQVWVGHLHPNRLDPGRRLAPRQRIDLDPKEDAGPGRGTPIAVGEPFGTDMMLAIATEQPLFGDFRPQVEPLAELMPDLNAALATARQRNSRIAVNAFVLETAPRR